MALLLTHKTTDETIERATRSELLGTVIGCWEGARSTKKEGLVNEAKVLRDRLKKEWEEQEAAKAAARELVLQAERDAGKVGKILSDLVFGLEKLQGIRKESLAKFCNAIAEATAKGHSIVSILTWQTESVMAAEYELDTLNHFKAFIGKEAANQTHLLEEIVKSLWDDLADEMRSVLRDGYRPNSTSVMHNVENMARFHGQVQYQIALLKNVLKNIERQTEEDHSQCRLLDDYCW